MSIPKDKSKQYAPWMTFTPYYSHRITPLRSTESQSPFGCSRPGCKPKGGVDVQKTLKIMALPRRGVGGLTPSKIFLVDLT